MLSIISLAQPRSYTDSDGMQSWPVGRIGAGFDLSPDLPTPEERERGQATDSLYTGAQGAELPFVLEMPGKSEGETVPASALVRELLWQHYGLDLRHPSVSRWFERRAPDVKYARAGNPAASGDERDRFRVGPDGTVEVHLSREADDRLREVSYEYLLSRPRSKFGFWAEAIFGRN